MKTETFLPLFNGFYHTIWWNEDEYNFEDKDFLECVLNWNRIKDYDKKFNTLIDSVQNGLFKDTNDKDYLLKEASKGLSNIKNRIMEYLIDDNKIVNEICDLIDYESYELDLSKEITNEVKEILIELGVITDLKMQKVNNPRQYNFANDSIDVEMILNDKNINKIEEELKKHSNKFKEYLKNKYTSYDGFISYYPNDINYWRIKDIINDKHKLGSALDFILKVNRYREFDLFNYIDIPLKENYLNQNEFYKWINEAIKEGLEFEDLRI